MHTRDKGDEAEELAVDHLQQQGYTILARNYHAGVGEVDIIARSESETVFVEVKSVYNDGDLDISETLTPAKMSKLRRAINVWMLKNPQIGEHQIRLDFIGVVFTRRGKLHEIVHHQSI